MNRKNILRLMLVICIAPTWLVIANLTFAANFQNLDFEQAVIQPPPANYIPGDAFNPISAAAALPHWTAQEDSSTLTALWAAPVALDETSVALVGPGYSPLQGNYSIQLYAYADAPQGYFRTASISQTGDVPAGTHSIRLLVRGNGVVLPAKPAVALNGTPISLIPQSANGTVTMAGDVTAFAGTTATLTIQSAGMPGLSGLQSENLFVLDSIVFSTAIVPEPSTLTLLAIGAVGLLIANRRTAMKTH